MIPGLSWEETLLRIALAAIFGGAIGLEREFREREAGLRTHMLVAVGSALFTITSAYGFRDFLVNGGAVVRADPTRVAAQIVTGIGFLGAGAIIRQGLAVRGLTTAATVGELLERIGVRIASFEVGDEDALDLLLDLPRGIAPGLVVRTLVQHQD